MQWSKELGTELNKEQPIVPDGELEESCADLMKWRTDQIQ